MGVLPCVGLQSSSLCLKEWQPAAAGQRPGAKDLPLRREWGKRKGGGAYLGKSGLSSPHMSPCSTCVPGHSLLRHRASRISFMVNQDKMQQQHETVDAPMLLHCCDQDNRIVPIMCETCMHSRNL